MLGSELKFEIESQDTVKVNFSNKFEVVLDNDKDLINQMRKLTYFFADNIIFVAFLDSTGNPIKTPSGKRKKENLKNWVYKYLFNITNNRVHLKKESFKDKSGITYLDYRKENLYSKDDTLYMSDLRFTTKTEEFEDYIELTILDNLNSENRYTIYIDKDEKLLNEFKKYKWVIYNSKKQQYTEYLETGEKLEKRLTIKQFFTNYFQENYNMKTQRVYLNNVSEDKFLLDYRKSNINFDISTSNENYYGVIRLLKELEDTSSVMDNRFTKDYQKTLSKLKMDFVREKSNFDFEYINKVRQLYNENNFTHVELAETLNINVSTLKDIINYKTWNPYIVNGLHDVNKNEIPLQELKKSKETKQKDMTNKFLNHDFKYLHFIVENLEFVLYKPINNQLYIEIYENDVYFGSIQCRYFIATELKTYARRNVYNFRIVANRFSRKSGLKPKDMYVYLNTFSEYFSQN